MSAAMRKHILVYGAGAIGSIFAVKFSQAGYDVTVYARSDRLAMLKSKGLLYFDNGEVKKAPVCIEEKVDATDIYDFIFVTVRYEQIEAALAELSGNASKNIVTMSNNPDGYSRWEDIAGFGRILPAFPGAGGKIENDVLHYRLTPRFLQSTTFGEITGEITERVKVLAEVFRASKVPFCISKNMDAWQKSHIAMVVSLASGFYFDGGDNYTTAKNKEAVRMSSSSLKANFNALKKVGIPITPLKLNVFRLCPLMVMDFVLRLVFGTEFAETVMASHAINAKDEMNLLGDKFEKLVRS